MRRAAHTFNLVAAADADKALLDKVFEEASIAALQKARQLWTAHAQCRSNADVIRQELNKRLQHVPNNMTRWSSVFDAVQELNSYLDKPDSRLVLKTSKS